MRIPRVWNAIGCIVSVLCLMGCNGRPSTISDSKIEDVEAASDTTNGQDQQLSLDVLVASDALASECQEPVPCPSADSSKMPVITCISPREVMTNTSFTLHLFGSYLQDDRFVDGKSATTKVSLDATAPQNGLGGNVYNGVPITACHLTVEVDEKTFVVPDSVKITAITAIGSDPSTLTIK